VDDAEGQLRIQWDRAAPAVARARSGVLEIVEGDRRVSLPLDGLALRKGSVTYQRSQARVDLHLTLEQSLGRVEEYASFLGRDGAGPTSAPPAASAAAPTAPEIAAAERDLVLRERDRALREAEQLRETNRIQTLRIRDLEDAMRVLRQRVDVAEGARSR
jgi:hypothetical protein